MLKTSDTIIAVSYALLRGLVTTKSNFNPIIFKALAISKISAFPADVKGRILSLECDLCPASPCRKMNNSNDSYRLPPNKLFSRQFYSKPRANRCPSLFRVAKLEGIKLLHGALCKFFTTRRIELNIHYFIIV